MVLGMWPRMLMGVEEVMYLQVYMHHTHAAPFLMRLMGGLLGLAGRCTRGLRGVNRMDHDLEHDYDHDLEEDLWSMLSGVLKVARKASHEVLEGVLGVCGVNMPLHSITDKDGSSKGSMSFRESSVSIYTHHSHEEEESLDSGSSSSEEEEEEDHESNAGSDETEELASNSNHSTANASAASTTPNTFNFTAPPPELLQRLYAPDANIHKILLQCITEHIIPNASPATIANFLRLHLIHLNPNSLGDFLSLPNEDLVDDDIHIHLDMPSIRYTFVRMISFEGMNLEQGLRHFLTCAGFRLPGEAQKVDRIIATFAKCYWMDNSGDLLRCPFQSEDTCYLLAFAVIMLNTDLHRSSGKLKKMTKQQFIHNLRGTYTSNASLTEVNERYMASIYDSIESMPIELHYNHENNDRSDSAVTVEDMYKAVKPSQELLRGLAMYDSSIPSQPQHHELDTLKTIVASTWKHFYDLINLTIDAPLKDGQCLLCCLDVLRYALCSAVFLKMEAQRRSFAQQLGRILFVLEKEKGCGSTNGNDPMDKMKRQRLNVSFYSSDQSYTNTEWHQKLESSHESQKNAREACSELFNLIYKVKKSLELDTRHSRELQRAVSCISGGNYLLNDIINSRSRKTRQRRFLMEGNFIKQGPSGKRVRRRLFLFNDRLLYTSRSSRHHVWKINGDLLLTTTKVSDCNIVSDQNQSNQRKNKRKHVFRIDHPTKSFLLFAPTAEDKKTWLDGIQTAITTCFEEHVL